MEYHHLVPAHQIFRGAKFEIHVQFQLIDMNLKTITNLIFSAQLKRKVNLLLLLWAVNLFAVM
jgi:hypothetical protein